MKTKGISSRYAIAGLLVVLTTAVVAQDAPVPSVELRAHVSGGARANIGETVYISGSRSTSASGEKLNYRWKLQTPLGSAARLSNAHAVNPSFTVDVHGDYITQLVVSDGVSESDSSRLRVSTYNATPIARTGPNQRIEVNVPLILDASASADPDGDLLKAKWRVISAPKQSRAAAVQLTNLSSYFTADLPGDYTLELTVFDDRGANSTAVLILSTHNARPSADAGPDRRATPGQALHFDALGSTDPEHASLSYQWSLLYAPDLSKAALRSSGSSQSTFTPDEPGLYVVQLAVHDGDTAPAFDTVEILVEALIGDSTFDADGDGVMDTIDNCVDVANPSQLDANGDGFGNRCDTDIDNDGFVTNASDLGLLRLAFFATPDSPNWNPEADFNGDNVINFVDLGIMRSFFFEAPGPIANSFINPRGGSWHNPANWSLAVVPDLRHCVRIDLPGAAIVDYSEGASEVRGIRTTSSMAISGGALSVSGDAQFNNTLTLQTSGSLVEANILAPETESDASINVPAFTSGSLRNVALAADVSVTFGGTLLVEDRLALNGGSIVLESSDSAVAILSMGSNTGDAVVDGVGEIRFGGTAGSNRISLHDTANRLIVGDGVTIRAETAGGSIQESSRPVIVNGAVVNSVDGATVSIGASLLTMNGSVSAANNARIEFGSLIDSTVEVTDNAVLAAESAELALFGHVTNDGAITVSDSILEVGLSNDSGETWINTGTVNMMNSTLTLKGHYSPDDMGVLTGTGELVLAGNLRGEGQSFDVADFFEGPVKLGHDGMITAATLVGMPLTIEDSVTYSFDNVTLATDLAMSTGSQLLVSNDLFMDEAVISMNTDDACLIRATGSSGTVFTFGGTGEILFNSALPDGTNVAIDSPNQGLFFDTGVTVRSVNSAGTIGNVPGARGLTFRGTLVSNVAGTMIRLVGAPLIIEGSVDASNDGAVRIQSILNRGLVAETATLTTEAAKLELFGDFDFDGTINANNGATIDIATNPSMDWINNGTINIIDSTLEIGGTVTTSGIGTIAGNGSTLVNGVIDNVGAAFDVGALFPGQARFTFGSVIEGGSIVNTPIVLNGASDRVVLDATTLATQIDVLGDAELVASGELVMDDGIVILNSNVGGSNASLSLGNNNEMMLVSGQGGVVFDGLSPSDFDNRIRAGVNVDLVIGPNIEVRTGTAGGLISATSGASSLTLQGALVSSTPGTLIGISARSMTVEGNLQIGVGTTVFMPDYTLTGGAAVSIDVAGSAAGQLGQLRGGEATLDGTLNIALVDGLVPLAGDAFELITYDSVVGTFANENFPALPNPLAFTSTYSSSALTLNVN